MKVLHHCLIQNNKIVNTQLDQMLHEILILDKTQRTFNLKRWLPTIWGQHNGNKLRIKRIPVSPGEA